MDSNTSLLVEMRMLNELRKLKPEQRRELMDTLEREERVEEEALKKNPNLHVETKLAQVLGELKDLRTEMAVLKTTCQSCPVLRSLPTTTTKDCRFGLAVAADDESSDCQDCTYPCPLFSGSIDWWPIIIFVFVFLTLFSLPVGGSKVRPSPISL